MVVAEEEKTQCQIHTDMLSRMDEKISAMHKWSFGNGQPGAAGRLVALETIVEEIKKPKQWPSVVASICAVIAVAINLLLVR